MLALYFITTDLEDLIQSQETKNDIIPWPRLMLAPGIHSCLCVKQCWDHVK